MLEAKDVNAQRKSAFRAQPMNTELSLVPDLPNQPGTVTGGVGGRRHQLLRLRSTHPDVFKEVIPLREDDVRRSTHLSELLHNMRKSKVAVHSDTQPQQTDLYFTEAPTAIAKTRFLRHKVTRLAVYRYAEDAWLTGLCGG